MPTIRITILTAACLLAGCVAPGPPPLAPPGAGGNFAAFGQDEDACRQAGAAAIQAAPADTTDTPARRYDFAYRQCMVMHGQMRQMGSFSGTVAAGAPPYRRDNPHGFEFPDAFFSVPYGTPGYGYDGFSY
jgi:hypothetical protein